MFIHIYFSLLCNLSKSYSIIIVRSNQILHTRTCLDMFASSSHKLRVITIFSFTSSYRYSQDKMEAIQNQILRIISITHQSMNTEEVVEVPTSLFECLNKENNYIISDTQDLREEINDLISDLNYISTLEKKVGSLNVEIDNINQNQH